MAVPLPYHLGHIVPIHGGVKHLGEITADRDCAAAHLNVRVQLWQPEPLVSGVVDDPPRLDRELQHTGERQPEWNRKTGAQIAFAVPTRDAVHGQHQDFYTCVLGPLQHGPVESSILVKIELIDLRCIVRLAQLLKAHRAERGYAEHRAVFCSRSRDRAFTLMVEKTLQGGGRAIDRQGELLTHDGHREINFLYAAQHIGYEVTALERFRVTPVGHLVISRAVDVIKNWTGQPSLGQPPEIMKVVTVAQAHACPHPMSKVVEGFTDRGS